MNIATVAVGDYAFGAAALINSLAVAGFRGKVFVGHQGPLNWSDHSDAAIRYVRLSEQSRRWPGTLKAELLKVIGEGDVCFIDADCIVLDRSLLESTREALEAGPVFAVEAILPASDVRIWKWGQSFQAPKSARSALDCRAYINSGFFAMRMLRDWSIVEDWQSLMGSVLTGAGDLFSTAFFPMPDQDCLNAVIAGRDIAFTSWGPPDIWYRAMSTNPFLQVGIGRAPMLLHCTGMAKPWSFERPPRSLPDIYDKAFYRLAYQETPWVRLNEPLAAGIARWIEDGALSKASLKARRVGARISHVARTLLGGG